MVVLNKIYTKTGDAGTTALGSGERVPKHALRIAAYGTVDETNAALGMARIHLGPEHATLDASLARIQNDLFDLGADLCVPDRGQKLARLLAQGRQSLLGGDPPSPHVVMGQLPVVNQDVRPVARLGEEVAEQRRHHRIERLRPDDGEADPAGRLGGDAAEALQAGVELPDPGGTAPPSRPALQAPDGPQEPFG